MPIADLVYGRGSGSGGEDSVTRIRIHFLHHRQFHPVANLSEKAQRGKRGQDSINDCYRRGGSGNLPKRGFGGRVPENNFEVYLLSVICIDTEVHFSHY